MKSGNEGQELAGGSSGLGKTSELAPLPTRIQISLEGDPAVSCDTSDYVRAKLKQLKEFGYTGLLASTIREQIQHVIAGHTTEQGLDVIGLFIEKDIVKD